MNLVLDFGNTRIKAGVFEGKDLVNQVVLPSSDALTNSTLLKHPITYCLIASVTNNHAPVLDQLSARFPCRLLTSNTPIPINNLYKSASTLGSDRLAASIGAFSLYPNQNVLTIDAGTCIKYNFVNSDNEYLGGAISPGLTMRLKAMHHYSHALPLLDTDHMFNKLVGQTTAESMLCGAQVATAIEMDGMIDRYKTNYDNLVVVITGGDSEYLCRQLKNRFFAHQNLLLMGLNAILNYSLDK